METNFERLRNIIVNTNTTIHGIGVRGSKAVIRLPELNHTRDFGLIQWYFSHHGIKPLEKLHQMYLAQMYSEVQDEDVSDIMIRFNAINGFNIPEIHGC